jgi:hypothetical protein
VVWALGWAVWGTPTSFTEYLSLVGSLILIAAGLIAFLNRRTAARVALVGTVAIWSLYFPAIANIVRVHLSDQELSLSIMLWVPSASPLNIQELQQIPGSSEMGLSKTEIQTIKETGIGGTVSTYSRNAKYGSGKKSRVTLIIQWPISEPVELKQPDATHIVYVQYGSEWRAFPKNAPTLKRRIRIQPEPDTSNQASVMVELPTGAWQGFGVSSPQVKHESHPQ